MRLLGSVLVSLVLVCPTAAFAQKATSAKLVGEWARQGEKDAALILRADSTFTLFAQGSGPMGVPLQSEGRWRLAGDTLMTQDLAKSSPETPAGLVQLKGKGRLLTVTGLGADAKSRTYERFKPSKSSKP